MNKKFILICCCALCIFNNASSQYLAKMWDYRFGGIDDDLRNAIQKTSDGGFILGGKSWSGISGDKTQASRDTSTNYNLNGDYWILKVDSLGSKQWDKTFGGAGIDFLWDVQQTRDGGYILGGASNSTISGDKTQDTIGMNDFWIIKTDSLGNKQWDKVFGGTGDDLLHSIKQTSDGGYIFGGESFSNMSGDKTQNVWGYNDFWVVKVDSLGNKQWDRDFGGTDSEILYSIQQTPDGGSILGGVSWSGINGDKTQPVVGLGDYWIVKIDSAGNKIWDKDFGGSEFDFFFSLAITNDGGFILGGTSSSGISGDKSQPLWGGAGDRDYWIIKADSLGNKEWDKDFGGTSLDGGEIRVSLTTDGGFLATGYSQSGISGDKTENNLGPGQTWVVKIDSTGSKVWDKTLLTNTSFIERGFAVQSNDGCYLMGSSTDAGIGGNKTQDNWDTTHLTLDFWIVKFCENNSLPVPAAAANNLLCPGTCTNFLNLSSNATSYQWSFPGAMPDTSTATNPTNICYQNSGSFDVQLIATNPNGSDTLLLSNYITVFPSPPPQAINQNGDTLFAIAGSASYQWYFNGNIINGATDYFYIAPASGDYNVVATDANGCEVEAAVFNVVASAQSLVISHWSFYPNPVEKKLGVSSSEFGEAAVEISVYNMVGEKVEVSLQESRAKNQDIEIDVSRLTPGMYYLEIFAGTKTFRTKFVKSTYR